jgi:putative Ca2+/H+ antiporter (TMEM165/GDT1 family)
MRAFFIVFGTVFLAELGDKTQIATFLFASKNNVSRLTVFLAAALALVLTSAIAVIFGDYLSKFISPHLIKIVGGIAFIVLGVFMLADI